MVREFDPTDDTTVGPRAEKDGWPPTLVQICFNMMRARFGYHVAFTYDDWKRVAEDKSFWERVDDNTVRWC